ncbi:MAG TPA: phosphatidate cytidylyltransferase [Solirubrobacteraceae bacterium]|nr:phosphatidate cytidylyltransferase [Solirubrobacteraceae bacterium]
MRGELARRVAVGVPAVAIAVALVLLGGPAFAVALALLGGACLFELAALYPQARAAWPAGIAAVAALVAVAQWGTHEQLLLVLLAAVPAVFVWTLFAGRGTAFGIALTLLGVAWIGMGLAHGVLLRRAPHGAAVVLDVMAATFVGDSAAYLGGRALGRHHLAPAISPNKTVEGLAFGVVAAVATVWVASRFEHWLHAGDALLLGAAVALAAPLGDLFESYVKRDAGAKDSGRLFGAHGGALDRLDAILFTAVAGYYVWRAILSG